MRETPRLDKPVMLSELPNFVSCTVNWGVGATLKAVGDPTGIVGAPLTVLRSLRVKAWVAALTMFIGERAGEVGLTSAKRPRKNRP